jgi:hypothetical protein
MDDRCVDRVLGFCPNCEQTKELIHFERDEVIENITVHCYIIKCLDCGIEFDDLDKSDPLEEFYYKKRLMENES